MRWFEYVAWYAFGVYGYRNTIWTYRHGKVMAAQMAKWVRLHDRDL